MGIQCLMQCYLFSRLLWLPWAVLASVWGFCNSIGNNLTSDNLFVPLGSRWSPASGLGTGKIWREKQREKERKKERERDRQTDKWKMLEIDFKNLEKINIKNGNEIQIWCNRFYTKDINKAHSLIFFLLHILILYMFSGGRNSSHTSAGKIISKKLFRHRSKSSHRHAANKIGYFIYCV